MMKTKPFPRTRPALRRFAAVALEEASYALEQVGDETNRSDVVRILNRLRKPKPRQSPPATPQSQDPIY